MIHYKLRITLTHCTKEASVALINKDITNYAWVEEKGKKNEQPHLHFYLITKMKEDTLRTHLRSLTNSCRGNKLYSLKKLWLEEDREFALAYLGYMVKEGTVIYNNLHPNEKQWHVEAKAYDDTVKEEMKKKVKKNKNRYQRIMEEFEQNEITLTYIGVIKFVIDWFVKEEVNVSTNTITSWTNTILLKYDIDNHRTHLVSLVMRNLTIQ